MIGIVAKRYNDDITRLTAVLAEQFDNQLSAIVEAIDDRIAFHLNPVHHQLEYLTKELGTVKTVVTDTNIDLKRLSIRVSGLEAIL